jgi:hypothetical protein
MENRNGRVLREHQHRDRCSDYDRSSHDGRAAAAQRPVRAALEQEHDRGGRGRHVLRAAAECQVALIHRVRAVDVFVRGHGIRDFADRQMRG